MMNDECGMANDEWNSEEAAWSANHHRFKEAQGLIE
jgi:hypothetical protein